MESLQETDMVNLIWDIQLLRYHGVAALMFLLWDTIISWGDEVQYIWLQSRLSPTKWVYLFTRYFGLLVQARLVSVNLSLILDTLSVEDCRILYISQVVFSGVLFICIQAIFMLRVYAFFIRDRRVAYAMITLLVAEAAAMPALLYKTVPNDTGMLCMMPIDTRDLIFFCVSAILPQLFVLGFTITRFLSGRSAGWGRIPIVARLVSDHITLVSIILVWVIVGIYLWSVKTVYGYIAYYWLLSIISVAGCRIVINMHKLTNRRHAQQQARVQASQLTTCIFEVLSLQLTDSLEVNYNMYSIATQLE